MSFCSTIAGYLIRKFLWYLCLVSLTIIAVLLISSAFAILQKYKSTSVDFQDFWFLVLLKIPYLFNEVSTIVGFISTILFLKYLSDHNELIVIVSNGLSTWRIFIIPIFLSFIFGVALLTIMNPIASYSLKKYKKIEARVSGVDSKNSFFLSDSGIFFCEEYKNIQRIIRARSINIPKESISDMTMLIVDKKNQFVQRIDASYATLSNNKFNIDNPIISSLKESISVPKFSLETNLSIDALLQRFTPPEMVSIWNLSKLINKLTDSGLPIIDYQVHFFKQLFKPISISSLTLLGFLFFSFDKRNFKVKTLAFALIIAVFAYFFLEVTLRILAYEGVTPIVATILPILFVILISNFIILHFQEY